MKIRYAVIRILTNCGGLFLLYMLQTSLFNYLELANVVPNLLLAFTSLSGFSKGRKQGMLIGLFSGFLLDFFSGQLFGTYALLYMIIGFLNGFFRTLFFGDDVKLPMLFVGISDILAGCANYLIGFAIRGKIDFTFYLNNIILPEAIYTVILSIFLYAVMNHIDQRLTTYERKRERRLG